MYIGEGVFWLFCLFFFRFWDGEVEGSREKGLILRIKFDYFRGLLSRILGD